MAGKTKGLGRGLEALFGEETSRTLEQETKTERTEDPSFRALPLHLVEPNPDQPRRSFDVEALTELTRSVREHGILTPIAVREKGGRYQILAGERRWRAARAAELTEIPALILQARDVEALEIGLIENLQREDLNPVEEAQGYQALMERFGMTQEMVAGRVGKSRPAIANALRLLQLPETIQNMLVSRELSSGHARALLSLASADERQGLAQRIRDEGLSVRQAEKLAKTLAKEASPSKAVEKTGLPEVDYYAELAVQVESMLGRKVRIVPGQKKGEVTLEFYGIDDLERLCQALMEVRL